MRLIGLLCVAMAAATLEPPELTATTIDMGANAPAHTDIASETIPKPMHADTQTLEPAESSTTLTSLKLNLPPLAHLSTTVSTSSHTVDTSVATPSGELDTMDAAKASSHSSISFVGAVAKAVAAIEDVIIGWPSHESIEHHNSAESKTAATNPQVQADDDDQLYTTFAPTLTVTSDSSVTMCINSNASSALNFDHEDGDDGTDVKIIKDIMARTLENTLEEVALAVEHETINSTGSMPNMYQESTMYGVNATRSDSAEVVLSTDVETTKTQTTDTAAPSAKEVDVTALASSDAGTSVSSVSKVSANSETLITVEKKPDAFTETLVHTIQTTTESIQTKPQTLSTSNANASPTAPPTPKTGEKKQTRSSKIVEPPPSASSVPKMAPSKRKKKDDPYNQASFDCGALILATNKGASSTTSILNKSKDQYMLNRCKNVDPKAAASSFALANNSGASGGSPKRGVRGGNTANSVGSGAGANFVIIELCNTIKIDTLVLANFEYFSSTFKDFNVYITDQYPPKVDAPLGGWSLLGSFHAANVRDFQYFKVKEPLFFTRFVKIEFLTYFGNEYYCPLTQVKAFGKTEIEAFREEEIISMAAELAEQEEAAEETLRTIALRAVKEIDAAACIPGDVVCEEAAAAVAERFVLGDIVPGPSGTAIFGTAGSGEGSESGTLFGTGIADVGGSKGAETTKTLTTGTSSTSTDAAATPPQSTEASSPGMSPAENPQSYILSADYFRLFMENQDPTFQTLHLTDNYSPVKDESVGENGTPISASNTHVAPVPSPSTVPLGSSSQESIFKTISKRLTLLERNATLSYKYIEEQSRAYHAAFVRVEIARSDSIRKALGECNKTMTRVVRELAKDYEAAWGLLLRDLERQRKLSDSRIKDVEKSLDKLSERMTRQIFYEFILVILLVLILTRIFTPTPINGLTTESNITPLGSPRGFRKRLSPYFARYATKPRQLDSSMDSDAYRRTASSRPQFRSLGVPSAEFGFMHEEEEEEEEPEEEVRDELEDNEVAQLAVEEEEGEIQVQEDGTYSSSFAQRVPDEQESEGSDVDYASVSESYRFGVDSPPQVATSLELDGLGVPVVPMPATSDLTNGTKVKQALQIDTSNSHEMEQVGSVNGGKGNPGKGRVNVIIDSAPLDGSPNSAKSEPVTPHMSSSSRTNGNSNGVTLNREASKHSKMTINSFFDSQVESTANKLHNVLSAQMESMANSLNAVSRLDTEQIIPTLKAAKRKHEEEFSTALESVQKSIFVLQSIHGNLAMLHKKLDANTAALNAARDDLMNGMKHADESHQVADAEMKMMAFLNEFNATEKKVSKNKLDVNKMTHSMLAMI
ncbi:hypothetical protein HDU81_000126 [Chytriomyces hyalinus]|nr:hypothetical protein HDU81_000126 [Chytriomyces hyalinus]